MTDRERAAITRVHTMLAKAERAVGDLLAAGDADFVNALVVEESLLEVATLASEASHVATRCSRRAGNRRRAEVARATSEACRKDAA